MISFKNIHVSNPINAANSKRTIAINQLT